MLRLPEPVVGVDWLVAHLGDPALRIADVRWSLTGPGGRERYDAGHLPRAIHLDVDRDLSAPGRGPGRHPLPTPEALAATLGSRGIGDEHAVVVYDDAGGSIAARLWWLFRHFGHDGSCAVLDGGIGAWTGAGHPLTTELPTYPPAHWTPGVERDDVVDADAVAEAARSGTAVLLDARAGERYRGEVEPIDPRPGHIPGALNAPWSENVDWRRFRSRTELRAQYEGLHAADRPVIAYCGSGITATHDLLALELAGIAGARLYAGSWSDWSSDPRRPAALGADP